MPCLKPADFRADIYPHRRARSNRGGRLAITRDTAHTVWFKMPPYGFGGVHQGATYARVKGIYVFPEWRGFGHGTALTLALIAKAEAMPGVRYVEAVTVDAAWYVERGFAVHSATDRNSRVRRALQDG
ncbi:MAG: GNAT family N-acetyltransferase [Hyphomicrobium sp.]